MSFTLIVRDTCGHAKAARHIHGELTMKDALFVLEHQVSGFTVQIATTEEASSVVWCREPCPRYSAEQEVR